MLAFRQLNPRAIPENSLGIIPQFLSPRDLRSAAEQFNDAYSHGGGWSPMQGWKADAKTGKITYPGDPPLMPLFEGQLREETIRVYPHAWVAIFQKDGSFEISRMD